MPVDGYLAWMQLVRAQTWQPLYIIPMFFASLIRSLAGEIQGFDRVRRTLKPRRRSLG